MGKFIGGIGAAFILAAAAAVIVKLLIEINVIRSQENALRYGKISLMTIVIGAVYMSAAALIFNEMKDRTNFFDLEAIYAFLGTDDILGLCENLKAANLFKGLNMPLYPCLVNVTGRLVFEQYVLTAQFVSFSAACVSSCMLYSMAEKKMDSESAENLMLLAASAPFAFMIFAPTYISLMVMFAVCGAYALSRNSKKGFIILAVLACLTGKIGILAFLIYPLKKYITKIIGVCEELVLKNELVFRVLTAVLVMFNGTALFYLIRGI